MSVEPGLVLCDEVVSALDVSIQADILNLLAKLQREKGIAYLFIAHDLDVVASISDRFGVMYLGRIVDASTAQQVVQNPRHPYTEALLSAEPEALPRRLRMRDRIILLRVVAETCDRVLTMYAGQIVEECSTDDALERPKHPYTSGLLGAIPRPGVAAEDLRSIPGRVPSPVDFPTGCRFGPRCEFHVPACHEPQPLFGAGPGRWARCHRHAELTLPGAVPVAV